LRAVNKEWKQQGWKRSKIKKEAKKPARRRRKNPSVQGNPGVVSMQGKLCKKRRKEIKKQFIDSIAEATQLGTPEEGDYEIAYRGDILAYPSYLVADPQDPEGPLWEGAVVVFEQWWGPERVLKRQGRDAQRHPVHLFPPGGGHSLDTLGDIVALPHARYKAMLTEAYTGQSRLPGYAQSPAEIQQDVDDTFEGLRRFFDHYCIEWPDDGA
jgi:hypothetical protein